jgi:hypothetical protein
MHKTLFIFPPNPRAPEVAVPVTWHMPSPATETVLGIWGTDVISTSNPLLKWQMCRRVRVRNPRILLLLSMCIRNPYPEHPVV